MTDNTQQRDYEDVLDNLIILANQYLAIDTYKMRSWIKTDTFKPKALAILQEFDAQNRQICPNCTPDKQGITPIEMERYNYMGAMADIDGLVETIVNCYRAEDWERLENYMYRNYKKQWNKYMNKETAPTAEPLVFTVGELYENEDGEKYMHLGGASDQYYPFKFYSYEDDRIEYVNSYGKIYPGTELPIIRKHTPKPAEHTYSMAEIILECENNLKSCDSWELRGKIIKQLLKELGGNV